VGTGGAGPWLDEYGTIRQSPDDMPKRDLVLRNPWLNAAGMLGFAPDPRSPVRWELLGAFVTNPISLRRRAASAHPALRAFPGGFLLHTGLPNPGFSVAVQQYGRRWASARLPIIVHLMADRPEETKEMAQHVETLENVIAIELGFAPLLSDDIISLAIDMSRGELPLIVSLPAEQVLRLGRSVLEAGAAAVSIAAPHGSLPGPEETISGRLYGPALLPTSLAVVQSAAAAGIPVIGAGGVFTGAHAEAMLAHGAFAIQWDGALWLPQ
jgi:dihydroorotate dehydrogenase (NAD+) catalytic subunit